MKNEKKDRGVQGGKGKMKNENLQNVENISL